MKSEEATSHPAGRLAAALLAGLLFYSPWMWAGLRSSYHIVSVVLAVVLLVVLLMGAWRMPRALPWRDPLFFAGLAFLAYLAIQWWNSGRVLYFDVAWQRWAHTAPPSPGWPSGFLRDETLQMLGWFFPAWVAALAARSPLMIPHMAHRVLRTAVYSAGALAVFGLAQYVLGAEAIFWTTPLTCGFFASFGYPNHAAAYFVMMSALAAGLLYREIFRADRAPSRRRALALAVSFAACIAGANLSLSRAGVILAWLAVAFAAGYGLYRGWPLMSRAMRARYVTVLAGAFVALLLTVAWVGDKAILREFGFTRAPDGAPEETAGLNLRMPGRAPLRAAAWSTWQESPWFGAGGWGFRHRVAFHLAEEKWDMLRTPGWANVHCDALQFLVEFGVVGCALGLAALAFVAVPLLRRWDPRSSLMTMGCTALGSVLLFSLIDLPFRCPAILITWSALAAALPRVAGRRLVPGAGDGSPGTASPERGGA